MVKLKVSVYDLFLVLIVLDCIEIFTDILQANVMVKMLATYFAITIAHQILAFLLNLFITFEEFLLKYS